MKHTTLALGAAMLLAATSSLLAQPQPAHVVIVHPANPVSALPATEVARMFLKQSTKWSHGWPVLPVDLPITSPVRASFSERVLGRSPRSIKSHWTQQIFSGRGVPPPERENEAEVVRFVTSNRGAIGYVSLAAAGGAKILQVR